MRRLIWGSASAFAMLAMAAPAAVAADGTCRASAARAALPSGTTVEPVRANAAGTPCTSQSASTVSPTTFQTVSADAVGAFTDKAGSALASAAHASATFPGLTVSATAVEATATAPCGGTASGTSRVVGLVINGNPVVIPPGDAAFTIPLGPLGSVVANEEIKEGATVIRRALHVTTPAGEAVLAEAIAAPGSCPAAAPPLVCPAGATYDPSRNVCIVNQGAGGTGGNGGGGGSGGSGGGGGNGSSSGGANGIAVGSPFQGPQGGTVMTLDQARQIAPDSVCLKGKKGPKYAIVGTAGNDKITGTNAKERILLLAGRDNAEGGRGDDCIDGGKGGDTMSGALGKDRIVGGSGNDHLVGGSHADFLQGGTGNDTIHSGFGKDVIDGGTGVDKINAATAGPASKTIKCGKGRDKIRVNRNEKKKARSKKAGCEKVYAIR
jgi:hypothetical protein